jgi:uncharacterized protein YjiS (DUF1127 family)
MHPTYRHLPTYEDTHRATHSPLPSRQFAAGGLLAWAGIVGAWFERSRQRRTLAELDDRLLDDIGVTRSEARREAAKPLWRAGKA